MESKKMDDWELAIALAEAHVIGARKALDELDTCIRCARASLKSLADDAEIGADLFASDTTSRSGGSSSGDREA